MIEEKDYPIFSEFGLYVIKCLEKYGVTKENLHEYLSEGRIQYQYVKPKRTERYPETWCRLWLDKKYICTIVIFYTTTGFGMKVKAREHFKIIIEDDVEPLISEFKGVIDKDYA